MTIEQNFGVRPDSRASWRPLQHLGLVVALAGAGYSPGAFASCLAAQPRNADNYSELVGRNPSQALLIVQKMLDQSGRSPERQAMLFSLAGEAAGRMSRSDEARGYISKGLAIAPRGSSARVELLWLAATNTFRRDALNYLKADVEKEFSSHAEGSSARTCLLIALGNIERMLGDFGASARHLTAAYRRSEENVGSPTHSEAMRILSRLMASSSNFVDALDFNSRALAAERMKGNSFLVGLGHGYQGIYLNGAGRFSEAVPQLLVALSYAQTFGDLAGAAHIRMHLCRSYIATRRWSAAKRYCETASRELRLRHDDSYFQAQLLLAEIDLGLRRPQSARNRLSAVVKAGSVSTTVNSFEPYRLRAEARYQLGDFSGAYADQTEYIQRYRKWTNATRDRSLLIVSEKIKTDIEIFKNMSLRNAIELEKERDNLRLKIVIIVFFAALLIIFILFRMNIAAKRYQRNLHRLAATDLLTGLAVRRAFLDDSRRAIELAVSNGSELSVAMIDVDNFKSINDEFGHPEGDRILKALADLFRVVFPQNALIGRWGGEEFLVLFPGQNATFAQSAVDEARLRASAISPALDRSRSISFSAGVASLTARITEIEQLISQADKALYNAKENGRNNVVIWRK